MTSPVPVIYKSGGALVTILFVLLGLNILADLACVGTSWPVHTVVQRAMEGDFVTENEAMVADAMSAFAALGKLLIWLSTVVVFCFWIFRAHKNLSALGTQDLQYTPGWAVGYYFIPILNLVRPFQVMSEIWRASSSQARAQGPSAWLNVSPTALIGLWWGALIVAGIGSRVSIMMARSESLEPLLLSVKFDMLTSGLTVFAAIFLMLIIKHIDDQQDESATNLLGIAPQMSGANWVPAEGVMQPDMMPAPMHPGMTPATVHAGMVPPQMDPGMTPAPVHPAAPPAPVKQRTVKVSIPASSVTPPDIAPPDATPPDATPPDARPSMPAENNPFDLPTDDTRAA